MNPPQKPFFSVVTVVFNDFTGLEQTYHSLLEQSCKDYEWIVVDGDSKDATVDFLRSISGERVRWISEPDKGIYDAMNKGIKLCSGRYVLFLNAGDFFPDANVMATVMTEIESCELPPDIVFGGANFIFAKGRTIYRRPRPYGRYIWHGVPASHQSTYFRAALLDEGSYDLRYKICGDYYLAAQLFTKRSCARLLDRALVNFRVGDTSYKNRRRLLLEPYAIQRRVLAQGRIKSLASLIKRSASMLGFFILTSL